MLEWGGGVSVQLANIASKIQSWLGQGKEGGQGEDIESLCNAESSTAVSLTPLQSHSQLYYQFSPLVPDRLQKN